MKKALFPGTFDPPTYGHLDLIERAQSICDKLIVGIAVNSSKNKAQSFSLDEKIDMLEKMTHLLPHVEVVCFSGLVVNYAKLHKVDFLLRGLRAFSDFEYEFRMALANRRISGLETAFLMADERHGHISSTLIRDLAKYQMRLNEFVPPEIEDFIFKRLSAAHSP